jgi:universal stress protein E
MNKLENILVFVDPTAQSHPAIDKAARIAQACGARLELFACETKDAHAQRYAAHLRRGGDFIDNLRAVLERLATPLRQRGLDVCIDTAHGDPLAERLLERAAKSSADLIVKDTHHHTIAQRTFLANTDWQLMRGCKAALLLTKPKPWAQAPKLMAAVDPHHVNDKPLVLDYRILDWATVLRDKLGGKLRVAHAYLPVIVGAEAIAGMPPMMSALSPQILEDERRRSLESVMSFAAPYGLGTDAVTVQLGVASDVIPRLAQDTDSDLVIMGAISRSGLRRLFIGSTAERVLEHLPCDVLVVRPPDFAAELPF